MATPVTPVDESGQLYTTDSALYVTLPDDLMTNDNGLNRRIRVDPGITGFYARRMWRVSYEFNVLAATPIVFKVVYTLAVEERP